MRRRFHLDEQAADAARIALSPSRYRAMLRSHDIGVALQDTPHPGLAVLDMAAAGLSAITSEYEAKTSGVLGAISRNVVATAPEPEALADAIAVEVARVGELDRRVDGATFEWPRAAAEAYGPDLIARVARMIEGGAEPVR